jgi:hypothetical protein
MIMRPRVSLPLAALAAAALAAAVACGSQDAEFTTEFTPEFAQSPRATVSVFGVYKDGRMSAEAWDQYGLRLSAPLASKACDVEFSTGLGAKDLDLFTAVDSYARANGVTDDLVDLFGPAAKGDLVVVFSVAGRLPQHTHRDGGAEPGQASTPMRGRSGMGGYGGAGRGMGGMGGGGSTRGPMEPVDTNALELSATLFSAKLHKAVGIVALKYTGSSVDEAFKKFTEKLAGALPAATCAGWSPEPGVKEDQVKKLDQ